MAGLGAAALLMLATWPAKAATTHDVSIHNTSYDPPSIAIPVGDSIKWTNTETLPTNHTVTSDNGKFTGSPQLTPGTTFTIAFTAAGTYPYHCEIHSTMHGTVVVQAPVTTTVTTRPPATTARPVATTRATTATTRATSSTSVGPTTTETLALETSTTEESTTTTTGDVAINADDGGGTNGLAIAGLVLAIMAVLGGGGYAIYRLRAGGA